MYCQIGCALQELWSSKIHVARALFPQLLHLGSAAIKHVVSPALALVFPSSWLLCSLFQSFSRHLVHLQEPNFHVAYVELLEKMDKGAMQKHLAVTTYKYIKVLLKSDRIKTQVSHSGAGLPGVCQRVRARLSSHIYGTALGCTKVLQASCSADLFCYKLAWADVHQGAAAPRCRWATAAVLLKLVCAQVHKGAAEEHPHQED